MIMGSSHQVEDESDRVRNVADGGHPRVLHVITGMGLGGAEKVVFQLASYAGGQGGIVWLKGPLERRKEALEQAGVALMPLNLRGLRDLPRAIFLLRQRIAQFQPEVVHGHLIHAQLLTRWAVRTMRGVPLVTTEHNVYASSRYLPRWLVKLNALTCQQDHAIVAVSEAVRRSLKAEGFRAKEIRVIYNGIESPKVAPPFPIETPPVITLVGRLNQQKGVDIFLEAMRLLPECRGWLVGIGGESERKRVADHLQRDDLQSRVRWDQTGMEGVRAMTEASVVVVPSRWEGLGIVALEAMALGRPVVASRVDGLSEVVQEGVTGLLVAPGSPEALAQAVRKVLTDPAQAAEMGRAGRQRVEEQFTLSKMRAAYQQLYVEILQKQTPGRAAQT